MEEEFVIKFESCSTLEDKVRLFWENPAIQEMLKDRVKVGICRKDEEAAKEKKDVGNKLFLKGRDTEALKNYNKALVLAPGDRGGRLVEIVWCQTIRALLLV